MNVISEKRRHIFRSSLVVRTNLYTRLLYLRFSDCPGIDISTDGLLVPEGITRPVASMVYLFII